jgi:hypothetical protein
MSAPDLSMDMRGAAAGLSGTGPTASTADAMRSTANRANMKRTANDISKVEVGLVVLRTVLR